MKDEQHLVTRLRERLEGLQGLTEKKMMGGHCFLVNGNMVGGADFAAVRCGCANDCFLTSRPTAHL